ncbi:Saccharopine dehydrogenase-domain-containing protein [Kockovaella imperatae]|uniref:Saccharopine dehydrogenase-domain-containing protein n=1 Tax=Kockovaella imperatae TaxID=4999 RepID=A0A1Y1UGQ2_9TREE|nr:Saccharopine dehydrogenase-domain-containing protein [Kockovaella imperatae]ORX36707.1 Saccharopine dehydrogenase-domain-containing protein [Kockovaella imperatae]
MISSPLRRPLCQHARIIRSNRWLTTIGIRREDPKRIWERRTPLTPAAVSLLARAGEVEVEVESCQRRSFPNKEYEKAGARIVPSLSPKVDLVLGIKEPPVSEVHRLIDAEKGRKRTWMVFSHTHKGQKYNTGLLSSFLGTDNQQTLIDYELLTREKADGKGRERVAAFGWYAGAVGAGEALTLTGLALLRKGIATSLLNLSRPYTFNSLDDYRAAVREAAAAIAANPPPEPIVIGVTGRGKVATGAMDILKELDPVWVESDRLSEITTDASSSSKVIVSNLDPAHYMRANGKENSYSRVGYYADPSKFKSHFDEVIAPHLTTLINGQGWSKGFPRILDNAQMEAQVARAKRDGSKPKLIAVQDITCDINGNLEFMDRSTTIDQPYYDGPGGVMISSIDILPSELPKDSSEHFSDCIIPYVRQLATGAHDAVLEDTLSRATIVRSGTITENHKGLMPRVQQWRNENVGSGRRAMSTASRDSGIHRKKKVLLLGSGLVAGPAAQVLGSRSDIVVRLASVDAKANDAMSAKYANMSGLTLDATNDAAASQAVEESDVVISLLPAPMHTLIAEHCVNHRKHLITASYVSDEMQAFNSKAEDAGIIILGECGLDPGIDSMAAMRIIDRANKEGKTISSFISWCGGLPELSASEVPLRYKFSWSPKAVLTAALNDAHYKLDDQIHHVQGDQLLAQHFPSVGLWDGLPLEGLANRDSLLYAEKYGLGTVEDLSNLFRGTLRYQGFSRLMDSFRQLGLLNRDALDQQVESWTDLLLQSVKVSQRLPDSTRSEDLPVIVKDIVDSKVADDTLQALEWFGVLPNGKQNTVSRPVTASRSMAPIDYFAQLLSNRLSYHKGERDTCLLHHEFVLHPASMDASQGGPGQKVTASLLAYGDDDASAMAVTVGKTLAFAALRVLDGKVAGRGVRRPLDKDVYEGVLDDLESVGVKVAENWA